MSYILKLPFHLAESININPITFLPEIQHPILSFSSSSTCLRNDVIQWLIETFGAHSWVFDFNGKDYQLTFNSEEDLTFFKMRWL